MKHNISLVCKKSSCLPPVKTVLGQLPQRKLPPTLTLTLRLTQTLTLTWGQFSSGAVVRTPVKTKETKNRKEIKNNRRKKKEIKQRMFFIKLKQSFIKLKQTFPNN